MNAVVSSVGQGYKIIKWVSSQVYASLLSAEHCDMLNDIVYGASALLFRNTSLLRSRD